MAPKKPNNDPDTPSLFATPAPLPIANLDDEERIACVRLIRSHNVGPTTFRELINLYGGAKNALEALPNIASRRGGRKNIEICSRAKAEDELAAAQRVNAKPIFTIEPGYPARLANLDVPPPLLYVVGQHDLLQNPAIAIVGARLASAAGTKIARQFASHLGNEGTDHRFWSGARHRWRRPRSRNRNRHDRRCRRRRRHHLSHPNTKTCTGASHKQAASCLKCRVGPSRALKTSRAETV